MISAFDRDETESMWTSWESVSLTVMLKLAVSKTLPASPPSPAPKRRCNAREVARFLLKLASHSHLSSVRLLSGDKAASNGRSASFQLRGGLMKVIFLLIFIFTLILPLNAQEFTKMAISIRREKSFFGTNGSPRISLTGWHYSKPIATCRAVKLAILIRQAIRRSVRNLIGVKVSQRDSAAFRSIRKQGSSTQPVNPTTSFAGA